VILPASYLNGFAPRDGQPLYPSLWKGCVGSWNPGLGPSGLVLRDQSGLGNNGTLTNGPTWAASQGRYAMNFDGTDDYVSISNTTLNDIAPFSICWWENVVTLPAYPSRFRIKTSTGRDLGILRTDQTSYYGISLFNVSSGASKQFTTTPSVAGGVGVWRHFTLNMYAGPSSTNSANYTLVVDKIIHAAQAGGVGTYTGNVSQIGYDLADNGAGALMDDIRFYNRTISFHESVILATRRGIAYEMAPRRRSSVQVTTNRLRRALIGS